MHTRTVYVYPGEVLSTVGAAQIKVVGITQDKDTGTPMMEIEVTAARFEIDEPDPVRDAVEAE